MDNMLLCHRIAKAGFHRIDSCSEQVNSFVKYYDDSGKKYLLVTVQADGTVEVFPTKQNDGSTFYTPDEHEIFLNKIEDKEYKHILISLIIVGLTLSVFLMAKLLG